MSTGARAELDHAAEQVAPALKGQVDEVYRAAIAPRRRLPVRLQLLRFIWVLLGGRAQLLAIGCTVLIVAALVVSLTVNLESLTRGVLQKISAAAGVGTLTAAWWRARKPWAEAQKLWAQTVKVAKRERDRLQTAIDVEAAQVTELQRELQNLTTAGQLAGFVADRAGAGTYRTRLGVMTQIREDFQHMAQLLVPDPNMPPRQPRGADATRAGAPGLKEGGSDATDVDAANDTLPAIDRIVLYIDDLDRCPPRRVVEMLEAIHLLLAVRLFVVAVAVDPRWLLRAIAVH